MNTAAGARLGLTLCLGVAVSACGGGQPASPNSAPDSTRALQTLLNAAPDSLPHDGRFDLRCREIGGRDFDLIVVRPGGSLQSAPDSPFAVPARTTPGAQAAPPFRGQTFGIYARSGTALPPEIFGGRRALLFGEGSHGGVQRYALDSGSAAILLTEVFANKIVVFRAYVTDGQLAFLSDRLVEGTDRARTAELGPAGFFVGEQQRLKTAFHWAFAQNRAIGILNGQQVSVYQCGPNPGSSESR